MQVGVRARLVPSARLLQEGLLRTRDCTKLLMWVAQGLVGAPACHLQPWGCRPQLLSRMCVPGLGCLGTKGRT